MLKRARPACEATACWNGRSMLAGCGQHRAHNADAVAHRHLAADSRHDGISAAGLALENGHAKRPCKGVALSAAVKAHAQAVGVRHARNRSGGSQNAQLCPCSVSPGLPPTRSLVCIGGHDLHQIKQGHGCSLRAQPQLRHEQGGGSAQCVGLQEKRSQICARSLCSA